MSANSSFFRLDPEVVLQATEDAGYRPTGEFSQLNSYENRVFDLRLEGELNSRVIAKFYRPGRWSKDCILEEHQFLLDLEAEGIPAVAPLVQKRSGGTLSETQGMWVAFFPKILGRMPEEFFNDDLKQVGRMLARIHNLGARRPFQHRPLLGETPWTPWESLDLLSNWVAPELWSRYEAAAIELIETLDQILDPTKFIRIHGDCHRGNLLFNEKFFFVDFDDCLMGPEAQDIWMLFQDSTSEEQELLLSGYEELREFPRDQLKAIPWLRGLRILSYSAWIARRWEDPSFPKLFPDFQSFNFWAEETESLEKIVWAAT